MAVVDDARALMGDPKARKGAITIAAATAALAILFWDALGNLWMRWGELQELSHSYFIPLISLWLVWVNRKAVVESVGAPSWWGVAILAAAGAGLIIGKLINLFLFQQIALVFAIAGLTATLGGLSLLRATAAPIAFLFFAVPPPYWFITVLSWRFQEMSSIIGVGMIQMMNIPVHLSGNIIDLGEYKLQVAEACSGLRYLFPFLSLGVMTAYLFRGPLWQKLVIVASTIPITIFMNSFRIAVTGALVQAYGTQHAEGALHFFEGWVVFVLCLLALFGVIALLGFFFTKPRRGPFEALGAPELKTVAGSRGTLDRRVAYSIIGVGAAALVGLSSLATTDELIRPERKSFASLPYEFEGWKHEVQPLSASVAEALNADDSIVVNMVSPEGDYVNLYLAYLYERSDGRAWHSPRQCIPGGGWQIAEHETRARTMPNGQIVNYNRLIIANRDHRQLVYYWYDQRGRDVANEFVMKIWVIYDSLTRKRGDGAMVRLLAPVAGPDGMAKAEETLDDMMDRLHPILPEYIPD